MKSYFLGIICTETCDASIGRLLFTGQLSTLHTVNIELPDGLSLYKSLGPHQTLHHIQIVLQTIDDLYVLLDRLVPNVETMIVQLCQTRLLSKYSSYDRRRYFFKLKIRVWRSIFPKRF